MIQFLKDSLRPTRRILTNRAYRELSLMLDGLRTKERYKPQKNVKFLGYSFDVPDSASAYFSFKEIFSDEIYKFVARSDRAPVIIDCGANIGASVIYFKMLYPQSKLFAIEADPVIFGYLKKNLERNGIDNVELINKAAWINDDGVSFEPEGADGGSVNSEGSLKIPSIKLKSLLSTFDQIDFLKIDVEGAETKIILDSAEELIKVDNLFVEYHSSPKEPQSLHELLGILTRAGFRFDIQHLSTKESPFMSFDRSQSMDLQLNIFCRQERLIR